MNVRSEDMAERLTRREGVNKPMSPQMTRQRKAGNGLGSGAIPLEVAHSTRSNRHSNPNAIFCSLLVMALVSGQENLKLPMKAKNQKSPINSSVLTASKKLVRIAGL